MGKKLQKKRKTANRRKRTSSNNSHSEVAGFHILHDVHSQLPNSMVDCDRISDLPDEILRQIISSLPFELVAQTRLLSTRWRDVWDITSVQKGSTQAMANQVTSFLESVDWVKPLAHPWKLQFHSDDGGCVLEASVGANNKLHLDFSHGESNWRTEFDLKLEINTHHFNLIPRPSVFPIRSLYLNSVNNLSSGMISSLLLNLHFLVSIEIKECKGMFGVTVNARSKLKHLTIIDCDQLMSISIIDYPLESLRYKGRFPKIYTTVNPSLKDVMLDCREGRCDDYNCLGSYLLHHLLLYVEHITLCQWTFQVMIRRGLNYYSYPVFRFLKELWWICSSTDDENINSLISLGGCPKLEKLYVTIDPSCYSLRNPSKGDFDWTSRYFKRFQCWTVVKMDGVTSEEDELKLADRIFQITTKKPTVLATSRNSSYTRRLMKINQNQRKFVEETDTELLNIKHIHMSS